MELRFIEPSKGMYIYYMLGIYEYLYVDFFNSFNFSQSCFSCKFLWVMLTYTLRAHVNNIFIKRIKFKYKLNRAWIFMHRVIIYIRSVFNMRSFSYIG